MAKKLITYEDQVGNLYIMHPKEEQRFLNDMKSSGFDMENDMDRYETDPIIKVFSHVAYHKKW